MYPIMRISCLLVPLKHLDLVVFVELLIDLRWPVLLRFVV